MYEWSDRVEAAVGDGDGPEAVRAVDQLSTPEERHPAAPERRREAHEQPCSKRIQGGQLNKYS